MILIKLSFFREFQKGNCNKKIFDLTFNLFKKRQKKNLKLKPAKTTKTTKIYKTIKFKKKNKKKLKSNQLVFNAD